MFVVFNPSILFVVSVAEVTAPRSMPRGERMRSESYQTQTLIRVVLTSHRIASHRIASRRVASHRVASHRVASRRVASHCIASHRAASRRVASRRVASRRIASHRVASRRISWLYRSSASLGCGTAGCRRRAPVPVQRGTKGYMSPQAMASTGDGVQIPRVAQHGVACKAASGSDESGSASGE